MDACQLISHVCLSVAKANNNESNIDPSVLKIDGMSSPKVRHLINNLCSFNDCSYLEVGSWKGSTLCSALNNNSLMYCRAYENFTEFTDAAHGNELKSVRDQLIGNIELYKGENKPELIEGNFFSFIDEDCLDRFNVYLYDGAHNIETQYLHLSKAKNCLKKTSIVLVDDWFCSVSKPKEMMFRAINDFGFYIHLFIELPSGFDNGYWGGQGLFILEKL